jgi:hypothetical protein
LVTYHFNYEVYYTKSPLLKVFHDLEKAQRGGADAEDKTERGVSRRGVIRRGGPSFWPDEEYRDEEMNNEEVGCPTRRQPDEKGHFKKSEIYWLNTTEEWI